MPKLNLSKSPEAWIQAVLQDFNAFLLDHASAEKKASGMAINMLSHYPDKPELVQKMTELAIEELTHFKEVIKIIHDRGLQLKGDQKDPYINQILKNISKGKEEYLIDRLIIAGIVEARGFERFGLIAEHLPESEDKLKRFYQSITRSEERHAELFVELAKAYTETIDVEKRCQELINIESEIVANLPIRSALH
jgi:tRNA-(ms[2]io[6]A)-hydroxylase